MEWSRVEIIPNPEIDGLTLIFSNLSGKTYERTIPDIDPQELRQFTDAVIIQTLGGISSDALGTSLESDIV